jgi:hypothetical protein
MQTPGYWAKTYGIPLALGLSAAKTGAVISKPTSRVPQARAAIAEAGEAEANALKRVAGERDKLQATIDEQASKRAAARAKRQAARQEKQAGKKFPGMLSRRIVPDDESGLKRRAR